MRIHPAEKPDQEAQEETPCVFIVFDLLVTSRQAVIDQPLRERRRHLESFAKKYFKKGRLIRLSPMTCDLSIARKWFHMGVGLDGIVAKREDLLISRAKRTGSKRSRNRHGRLRGGGFRHLEKKKLMAFTARTLQ